MARKSLRQVLLEANQCVVAPCVYDCASARAVEMVGFPAMMLSGGEVSIAMNGVIDYGFSNLTDIEWITSRISQTSPLPLAADIENGYGGPLAVYRAAKRMARAGATALQLEDSGDMEESTKLLPREQYYAKVKAALAALEGTDCILIARTNADPATELDEGIERCRPNAIACLALLVPAVFLSNTPYACAGASIQAIVPNRARAQVTALYITVTTLVGLALGPLVVGLITDHVFRDPADIRYSLALLVVVAAPAMFCLLRAAFGPYRRLWEFARAEQETGR